MKLNICIPCYSGVDPQMLTSLLPLFGCLANKRMQFSLNCSTGSLICRSRNVLAHRMLQTDATHLLFLDSDMAFRAEDIERMLEYGTQPGYELIGGLYPAGLEEPIPWARIKDLILRNPQIDPSAIPAAITAYNYQSLPGSTLLSITKPVEVDLIGSGLMLIHRSVFERMNKCCPEIAFTERRGCKGQMHAYFQATVLPERNAFFSEDYFFCNLWRKLGGKVWVCPWFKVSHYHKLGTEGFINPNALRTEMADEQVSDVSNLNFGAALNPQAEERPVIETAKLDTAAGAAEIAEATHRSRIEGH